MSRKKEVALLCVLIILLFAINYNFLDSGLEGFLEEKETGFVERIVDGDTVIINGNSTRLLGINTPERGEIYYEEAKLFLENLILNQTVELKFGKDKIDKYKRKLAWIFLNGKNINFELVRNGWANVYILDDKMNEKEIREAWKDCIASGKNLCEKSGDKCANCIELKSIDLAKQEVVFYNKCGFNCNLKDWTIKDEGRKKFVFENFVLNSYSEILISNEDFEEDYVWTDTGDTLFLRDEEGKLVLWEELSF